MNGRVLWVLFLTACSGLEAPQAAPFGFLRVVIRANEGQPAAFPDATFLNTIQSGYPSSRDTTNVCTLTDVAATPVSTIESLDAGDSVAFTTGFGTVYLYPTRDVLGNESYRPKVADVALTPGTEVTFQIPGAAGGFPEATLSALTAPALTQLSTIPNSVAVSDSMVVTWAPAGDDSSRIEIVLQYAGAGVPAPNRQVLCQWRDDGRGAIGGKLLIEWSSASLRRVQVTRFRTTRETLAPGPVLYFIATYDTLPPVP